MTLSLYAMVSLPVLPDLSNLLDRIRRYCYNLQLHLLNSRNLVRLPLNLRNIDAFLHHLIERRQLAKFLHDVDQLVGYVIDFGLVVEAAQAEADRAVRDIVAEAQSLQYIRWLKRR